MPLIDEYKVKKATSFKKKSYRPWDIEIDEKSLSNPRLTTIHSTDQNQESQEEVQAEKISLSSSKSIEKIEQQLDYNKVTIEKHLYNNQITIKEQTGNKLDNNQTTIRKQKKDFENPVLDSVYRLCGLQRKILFYIVNQCLMRGQLNTGPITNEALRDIEKSSVATIKTSLHRLVEKRWIFREKGKTGRGGFVSFKVTENVYNKVLEELKNLGVSK